MQIPPSHRVHAARGSALVTILVFVFVMGISVTAVHTYTVAVANQTAAQGELLRANAAAVFKDARIYNQADVRIKVSVATVNSKTVVTKTVVNVDGTPVNAATNSWVTPLLNAVNVNTTDFTDRSRSTSTPIQSTDVNVGAMSSVMTANPSVFPTGIVYVWDSTGLDGSTARPLTGVRLWNAGVLPDGGLVVGGNWNGDISYNTKAAKIKLNWGTVNFVRDRTIRTQ